MPRRQMSRKMRNATLHQTLSRREMKCQWKTAHADKGRALASARHVLTHTPAVKLWVYRCDICKKWHITSKSGNSGQVPAHTEE